ncbi:MAG: transcriptional repressor, partial [Rhizobiaceae bacterium]|nr:transcriptional repressor [Rhizobiaceae bacterium]
FHSPEIEALQERIAREHGFKLVDHRLELYGIPLKKDEADETDAPLKKDEH